MDETAFDFICRRLVIKRWHSGIDLDLYPNRKRTIDKNLKAKTGAICAGLFFYDSDAGMGDTGV